jgi:TolB-like protein
MLTKFLGELRRRRVLNTASFYVIGAWLALQVADVLSEAGLPPNALRQLLLGVALGFPVVLVIGWFFDISSEGIRRTGPVAQDEAPQRLQFIDYAQIAGLLLVMAVVVYVLSKPMAAPITNAPTAARQYSLAVLPLDGTGSKEQDDVGMAIADELRQSLTRTAGLRVLGPQTSAALVAAGEDRYRFADELDVTTILGGSMRLDESQIFIEASLSAVPQGNVVWSSTFSAPVGDAIAMQRNLVAAVIAAIAPALDPDPYNGPRVQAGACRTAYATYLRGLEIWRHGSRDTGRELIRQATEIDPDCAIAWEALAVRSIDYSISGFAKAGSAARRALELNDRLPEAWTVLAEIAEQEARWTAAEEYFLKAIYSDPTNVRANMMYSEALLARGRAREALRYALEAYRHEPADRAVLFRVAMAARYVPRYELVLDFMEMYRELRPAQLAPLAMTVDALIPMGRVEEALAIISETPGLVPDWYPNCIRARNDPQLRDGLPEAMAQTRRQIEAGELDGYPGFYFPWHVITCSIWIGENDFVIDMLLAHEATEVHYFAFFVPESSALRQHPRFRRLVVDTGLLDYWRTHGWADVCRPDGDSFVCD